jgi:hypothetical protein
LIFQSKEPLAELAFTLYYPEMVYANPRVAEIDLLLIFEGGYVCVELKKKSSEATHDSLKYFVNGLAQQPVFYASKNYEKKFDGDLSPPFLISQKELLDKLGVENLRSYMELVIEGREKMFSLDNFLRLLLVYGSPNVCRCILDSKFFRKLSDEFQLVKIRRSQIKKAKSLASEEDALPSSRSASENAVECSERIVAVVGMLENEFLRQKVAQAIGKCAKKSSTRDVILLCTERSKEDAGELKERLDSCVQTKTEIVGEKQGENIEMAWVNKIFKLCEGSCTILCIGEIPKGVLVGIAERLNSNEPMPKLAVLTWKPQLDLNGLMKKLEEGDVETEKMEELHVVEL